MRKKAIAKKGAGRAARTIRSLVSISALGVILAVYNAVSLHRDIGLAVGPAGPAQEQFFRDSSERPDIATFFKNLTSIQRLRMSKNIGRYSDPELAKLCGKCLDTFDAEARKALTASLAVVAKAHPAAAAALLTLPGSFQQLAIGTALRQAGATALPLVAKEFSENDARANAIAYLVASGPSAIAPTLPYLASTNKDVRLAAADTLGKLRAREAVDTLTKMFKTSDEGERLAYLTALAAIGDPESEALMKENLSNTALPTPHRSQAALGLGVIGTTTSLTTLWSYALDVDISLRESAISALQVAGDPALRLGTQHAGMEAGEQSAQAILAMDDAVLQVAGGIHTAYADNIIRDDLISSRTSLLAAKVAGGRPTLVAILTQHAKELDAATQGDVVDSILRALATTSEGRAQLKALDSNGGATPLAALAARRIDFIRG